jgi:Cu2+-exporting ATPase
MLMVAVCAGCYLSRALSLATPAAMLASAGALARGGVMVQPASDGSLVQVDTVVF